MKDFLGKFLSYFLVLGFIVAFGGVMEYVQKKSHPAEIVEIEDEEIVPVKKIKRKPASVPNNFQMAHAPMERGLTQSSSSSGFSGSPFSPEPPAEDHSGMDAGSPSSNYAINPDAFVSQGSGSSYGGGNGSYSTNASGSSAKGAAKTTGPVASGITSTIIPGLKRTPTATAATTPVNTTSSSSSSGSNSSSNTPDTAPVAASIAVAALNEDTDSGLLTLSYTDAENHPASSCQISALSNVLVAQSCSCSGGVCSVKIKSTANFNGAGSFSYSVTANGKTSNVVSQSVNFLAVNDAPVISVIGDDSTNEDQTKFVNFSISDVDSTLTCAGSVTKASSDIGVVPVANITIAGTAPNCTATIVPGTNKFGASDITLTVSDTLLTADEDFTLTVNQLADDAVAGIWDFDTADAGDFSSNPLIAFLAGKAFLVPLDQTDDDADAAGFSAGTAYGVTWDSGKEALTLANSNGCDPYETQDPYQHLTTFGASVIAAYHLDGTAGAISDTQNMVTLVGPTMTTYGPGASYEAGRMDEGVRFASGMRMATPDFAGIHRNDGDALTLMAWIKPSFNGGNYQQIIANRDSPPIYNWMLYQHMDNGELSFHGGNQFKSNYIPRNDEWIHVIVTVSTSGISKMYVNSDLKHTENNYIYAQAGTSQKLILGGAGDPAEDFFDGALDDVIVLTTELSQADVRKVFDQTSMLYEGRWNGTIANCMRMRDSWTPRYEKIAGYWPMENVNTNDAKRLPAVAGPDMRVTNSGSNLELVDGKLGSALRFKTRNPGGSDNILKASNNTFGNFGTNDFTIQYWAKFTNNGAPQYVISKRLTCAHESFWSMALQPSNHMRVELDHDAVGSIYAAFQTDNPLPMDRWTLISLVREGGTARLFVDGKQDASVTFSPALNLSNNASTFLVGDIQCTTGNGFQGDLDELSVWDAALTATEIKQIYERQSASLGKSDRQGVFISRVFAADNGQTWSTFLMKSLAPFGKELTATNESITHYAEVEPNLMDDIQAIWHLNEASGNIQDAGPNGYHGTAVIGPITQGVKGKLGKAVQFDGESYGAPSLHSFIQGPMNTSALVDYTISAWVTRKSTQEWATIFSTNVTTVGGAALGMQGTSNLIGMNNVGAGTENISVDLGSNSFNKWIFVTARMVSGTLTIDAWMDGQHFTASGAVAFGANNTSGQFYIGRHFSSDAQFWNGLIDEVAVWSRGLSNDEIHQLYVRGASRTKIQVKKCTTATCTDTDWMGSDGKPGSYFSESNNNADPVNGAGAALLPSANLDFSNFVANGFTLTPTRYFQYRLIFETDSPAPADSPNVELISIGPNHYPTSAPSIEVASGFDFLSLTSFTFTTSCSGLKIQLSSDDGATWKWHNGTGWVASNGTYPEASNLATIQSNIATFSGPGKLKWRAFMGSDGSSACELDYLNIGGGI